MRALAVYNVKGGVGKTSVSVNLAWLAAREGRRALLWDLDPQGAASFLFRVDGPGKGAGKRLVRGKWELSDLLRGTDFPGLDLIPADSSYRKLDLALAEAGRPARRLADLIAPLVAGYDFLFFDCPPSLSVLAEAVFALSDALLVPTVPTPLSLRALEQLAVHLSDKKREHLQVLPFLSMVDRRKRIHRSSEWIRQRSPFPILGAEIPYLSHIEEMGLRRAPVPVYAPASPGARAYGELWEEVRGRL